MARKGLLAGCRAFRDIIVIAPQYLTKLGGAVPVWHPSNPPFSGGLKMALIGAIYDKYTPDKTYGIGRFTY